MLVDARIAEKEDEEVLRIKVQQLRFEKAQTTLIVTSFILLARVTSNSTSPTLAPRYYLIKQHQTAKLLGLSAFLSFSTSLAHC